MKHRRALVWISGIFAALMVIVVAAAILIPDTLGKQAGSRISNKIGREFSIDGPIHIGWHWTMPRIEANNIRLANLPDSKDPYMLDIEKAEFTIKIWKLLVGRLDIPDIRLTKPLLVLEKKDADTKNWDLGLSTGNVAVNAALPSDRHDMPLIGRLRITDGKLIYRDAPRKMDITLAVDVVHGKESKDDEFFTLTGDGTLLEQPFKLEARGGSLDMMRDTSRDYPMDLAVSFGKTNISLNGTFRDPVQFKGLDALLKMSGSNLADLYYVTGIPLPPTPSYTLEGKLFKGDTVWKFNEFVGKVGKSDLSGDVSYDTSGERSMLSGALVSQRLDVADLGGFIGAGPSSPKQKTGKLLPDVSIDLTRLRASDIDLTFKAKKLNAPGWPLSQMNTRITLDRGLLKFDPLSFGVADGTVSGALHFDGRKEIPDVTINLDLKRLSIRKFITSAKFDDLSQGYFGGQIHLQGQGKSLADVLAGSDGRISLIMSGGKISLLIVEAADLDVAQLTPLLLGRKNKKKTTPIRCAVGDFDVTDGMLHSRIFVLDTDDSNIQGKAKIDLEKETIDAAVDAKPKDKSPLALQSKILIKGPLKKPRIFPDPVTTGIRGATAVAVSTVLTPLAAFLPFIEMKSGTDSDCGKLIQKATTP